VDDPEGPNHRPLADATSQRDQFILGGTGNNGADEAGLFATERVPWPITLPVGLRVTF
jgi:hypothetical protein